MSHSTHDVDPAASAERAFRLVALIAIGSILLGFAMQTGIAAARHALGDGPGPAQFVIQLAGGVSWAFFVCSGIAIATTLSRARATIVGAIGAITAPIAIGLAKSVQKVTAEVVGELDSPALLPLSTISVMRAIEYGLLGWLLATLARRRENRVWPYLACGAVIGLVFGGFISMMALRAAEQSGEPLSDAAAVAAVLNEVTFPIGCSLLIMVVVIVGRNVKAMEGK